MAQRVMIAMALACVPELLIADEPTTALDVTIQAQILDLMRNLRTQMETSIILITHDLGVVAEMCDRVNVMYAGRIVEEAAIVELFKNPKTPLHRCAYRLNTRAWGNRQGTDDNTWFRAQSDQLATWMQIRAPLSSAHRQQPGNMYGRRTRIARSGGEPLGSLLVIPINTESDVDGRPICSKRPK